MGNRSRFLCFLRGRLSRRKRERQEGGTDGSALFYDVLQPPVECFAGHLSSPHEYDEVFSGLDG